MKSKILTKNLWISLIVYNLILKYIILRVEYSSCEKIFVSKEYWNDIFSKFHSFSEISDHLSKNKLYVAESFKLNFKVAVFNFFNRLLISNCQ
jgi:hypothetical protein